MREVAKKVNLLQPLDINRVNVQRDHYFRNAFVIDLPLDSSPEHVWLYVFQREWKTSRHLWDRKLFVMGDNLRLVTTEHELEEKLDWVKQVIERANKDIDEYNKDLEMRSLQIEKETKRETDEEKAKLDAIKSTVGRRLKAF
jgi:hypothetical protein